MKNISSRFFSTLRVASASLWVEPLFTPMPREFPDPGNKITISAQTDSYADWSAMTETDKNIINIYLWRKATHQVKVNMVKLESSILRSAY